jgi:hypothetical protein
MLQLFNQIIETKISINKPWRHPATGGLTLTKKYQHASYVPIFQNIPNNSAALYPAFVMICRRCPPAHFSHRKGRRRGAGCFLFPQKCRRRGAARFLFQRKCCRRGAGRFLFPPEVPPQGFGTLSFPTEMPPQDCGKFLRKRSQ